MLPRARSSQEQFLHEYKSDFNTQENIMSTFLGMELEQIKDSRSSCIQETIDVYKSVIKQC